MSPAGLPHVKHPTRLRHPALPVSRTGDSRSCTHRIGANGRAEVLSRELKDSKSQKQCYLGWGKVKLPIGPQLPKAMTDLKGMGKES